MESFGESEWRAFSKAFGSLGVVITLFSVSSNFELLRYLISPHIYTNLADIQRHKNQYLTITGVVSDKNSFPVPFTQAKSNKSQLLVYSKYKKAILTTMLNEKKFFNKEIEVFPI